MFSRCLKALQQGLPSTPRVARRCLTTGQDRYAWIYRENGPPREVLSWERTSLSQRCLEPNEIRVSIVYSSINPADLNVIEGKYPMKRKGSSEGEHAQIPGSEAIGVCTERGSSVNETRVGDVVVPCRPHLGTWAEEMICDQSDMTVLPRESVKGNEELDKYANLSVCFATAYRMLNDFVKLEEGDFVIQNGSTSAVGQSVLQLASRRGLNTVNLLRNRDGDTLKYLNSLVGSGKGKGRGRGRGRGKSIFSTLETLKQDCQAIPRESAPKLGLNCVGGELSEAIAKKLQRKGTLVTYGGMSMKACSIPTPLLIFKDIRARGFWLSGSWYPNSTFEERKAMITDLCEAIREDELSIKKVKTPMEHAMETFTNAAAPRSAKVLLFN